jgi:hypothetical protein
VPTIHPLQLLDQNGDGYADEEEYKQRHSGSFEAAELMHLLDANRDGKISKEEFAGGGEGGELLLRHFQVLSQGYVKGKGAV